MSTSHCVCTRCDHFLPRKDAIEVETTELIEGIHDRPAECRPIIELRCPNCNSASLEAARPCVTCTTSPAVEGDEVCDDCLALELGFPNAERETCAAERAYDDLRETFVDIALTGAGT